MSPQVAAAEVIWALSPESGRKTNENVVVVVCSSWHKHTHPPQGCQFGSILEPNWSFYVVKMYIWLPKLFQNGNPAHNCSDCVLKAKGNIVIIYCPVADQIVCYNIKREKILWTVTGNVRHPKYYFFASVYLHGNEIILVQRYYMKFDLISLPANSKLLTIPFLPGCKREELHVCTYII